VNRTRVIAACASCGRCEITVGFVDNDKVGQFHDAALDSLKLVAAAG
jgi:hypothetical protein